MEYIRRNDKNERKWKKMKNENIDGKESWKLKQNWDDKMKMVKNKRWRKKIKDIF